MTPITLTLPLDHFDPLHLYLQLCPQGPGFLESLNPTPRTGRFSILPLRVRDIFRLDEQGLAQFENAQTRFLPGDPFVALEKVLAARRLPQSCEKTPFPGGFFGYLGYDLARWIEDLPHLARRDLPVPALWLAWVDVTAVYDHAAHSLTLAALDQACDLEQLARRIKIACDQPLVDPRPLATSPLAPVLSREEFIDRVRRAQDYIAAGDIYQANLSCRFDGHTAAPGTDLYAHLRRVNPSPFACYLRTPEVEIISSSPERLVSLHGRLAETRPIAGTRPRGYTPPEDVLLGNELLGHPKERAEHVMLLDLERNDLGKVCTAGSVEVDEFMVLERYSHVTHIVSNVRGLVREDCGPFELLRAMFPGGTITGVPKKRCMEIIEELEPVGRGTYTGSAGYISAGGEMDWNILIRTFQRCGKRLTYQTGAGIVADSNPEHEWAECLAKGAALRKALEGQS
ncbi:para-aminobenzoate synthetase component 1 [Geoalkalibacter ferrihydriticus]|uniref:Anthranilate synthase component 1 n=2 Tax=Geoalkalibacter ferrihydriticus TaxID=392333 RepID=A0A0C2DSS4_9BACT|nr:anthranilate synthase component I family protein [Geoalkalibacter ferrihydriticus]KIH76514.1 aminodeoxychorismate synthase [Geoalkalibacter ferrihydriticus DSM 17813]SDL99092.1 para-aminobenzoate synthetase component 1 [Geoalkalibacter ferrihydriticus]